MSVGRLKKLLWGPIFFLIRLGVGLAPLAHLIIYDLSEILQPNEFAWTIRSSVCVFFNPFLLKDATDRSKISSDHNRI